MPYSFYSKTNGNFQVIIMIEKEEKKESDCIREIKFGEFKKFPFSRILQKNCCSFYTDHDNMQ